MHGILLETLQHKLFKVDEVWASDPARTITDIEQKLSPYAAYIDAYFDSFDFFNDYSKLPFKAFSNFSFEDICKLRISTTVMMDRTVDAVFESDPNYEIVRKIKSSWWRWGVGRGDWNELVDVYNGICSFTLDLPADFTIFLDHTNGYNPCGGGKHSYTYLDGVFAFLIHYRGVHVMTIGFSVMENRRLLIQQVQLVQPSGNRWLYKFPSQRMEYVVTHFAKAFPDFALYIADGQSLMEKIVKSYRYTLEEVTDSLHEMETSRTHVYDTKIIALKRERKIALIARIAHVESDSPRLAQFYAGCGRYRLGAELSVNHLVHRKLE